MRRHTTLGALAGAAAFAATTAVVAQPADLVITNANVWTGDPDNPAATTIAIRDGVITALGDDIRRADLRGARVINAGGKRVLPGLMDTHVHIVSAGTSLGRLELRGTASREDFLNRLREYANTLGADEWVLGRGWSAESWPDPRAPYAEEIDEAVGGRPAVLTRMDGHSLIAGKTALDIAGVTKEGPADPLGGKIGRKADGMPDGALYEGAMGLVNRHTPRETRERTRELLVRAIAHANSLGVTQIGAIESRGGITNYLVPLDRAGALNMRVSATVSGAGNTLDSWRPALDWAARNRNPSPNVTVVGFKGYMDGSLGSRTAWMDEPFADNSSLEPNNAGFPLAMAATEALGDIILAAAELGLQPAVHAIGDRANYVVLNWFEAIPDSQRRAVRPRVEHAQHILPQDVARFADLGVIPSMQPYHKMDDGRYALQRVGPERVKTSYPFRQFLDTGAALAFGSDWPVVTVNPWMGVYAAVTAKTLDGGVFVPEQSISVEEALVAYTRTAAFCLHSEETTGMIKAGFKADIIMIDQDVLAVDPERIPDTKVLLTVVGGRVVHEAE